MEEEEPMIEPETEPKGIAIGPKDPRNKSTTKYNPISRFIFSWLDPLLWYGSRHTLQHEDLYCHPAEGDSKYLLEKFNRYWNRLTDKGKRRPTSLLLTLIKCVLWRFVVHGILFGSAIVMYIGFALLLGIVTDYLVNDSPTHTETANAYYSAAGMALLTVLSSMCVHLYSTLGYKIEMFIRIICSTVIYQKILTLSQTTVSQVSVGHIINLISNDVHRFDKVFFSIQILWVAPVLLVCATYILYNELGVVAFVAMAIIIGQMLFQSLLCRALAKLRLKAANKTDGRLKVMNEVITGMRVIKMYGWENAFHDLVSGIRRREVSVILKSAIVIAIYLSSFTTALPIIMFITFSVFAATQGLEAVTPRRVFTSLTLLGVVTLNCNTLFVLAIIRISEAFVALKRIQHFLLLEIQSNSMSAHINSSTSSNYCYTSLELSEPISFSPPGDHSCDGTNGFPCVSVSGLSCSWNNDPDRLTLNNVSFTVDKVNKLLVVIGPVGSGKSTLLQCLLRELPLTNGDISTEGTIAYAGQEQWIFSDTLRENILFGESYESEWYQTVINACALNKDIDMLPNGDLTLVGERGVTLSGGQKARVSLARAVYRKAGIYLLDDPLSAVDAAVCRHIFEVCIKGLLLSNGSSVVILVTHQTQYVEHCDTLLKLCEGNVDYCGQPKCIMDSFKDTEKIQVYEDSGIPLEEKEYHNEGVELMFQPEDKHVGTISYRTYYKYFRAGGGNIHIVIILITFILVQSLFVISDWWLASWTTVSLNGTTDFSLSARIGIYGGLVGSAWVLAVLRVILLYHILLRASQSLHNSMFIAVLRSPILFFDTNPVGRILNRFSKDTGFMDGELISSFCTFLTIFTRFLIVITTAAIANYYLAGVILVMLIVFMGLRWYFLKTSRQIKRLESLGIILYLEVHYIPMYQ